MKIMEEVKQFFNDNIAPPHKIISVKKQEENGESSWRALVEVIE